MQQLQKILHWKETMKVGCSYSILTVTKVTATIVTETIVFNIGAYLVELLKQPSSCGVVAVQAVVLAAVNKVFLVVLEHT